MGMLPECDPELRVMRSFCISCLHFWATPLTVALHRSQCRQDGHSGKAFGLDR